VHIVLGLLMFVLWGAFATLNYWVWSKAKANGNLLMLIGSGLMALESLLGVFGVYLFVGAGGWVMIIEVALIVIGFYLSVKPMVEAQLHALTAKAQGVFQGAKKPDAPSGGGTPPPAS
jgi:hypothetical protein